MKLGLSIGYSGAELNVPVEMVQRAEALASTDRLRISGARVLGTVLNRYVAGKGGDDKHYYNYYQYHAYGESDDRPAGTNTGASGTSAA